MESPILTILLGRVPGMHEVLLLLLLLLCFNLFILHSTLTTGYPPGYSVDVCRINPRRVRRCTVCCLHVICTKHETDPWIYLFEVRIIIIVFLAEIGLFVFEVIV